MNLLQKQCIFAERLGKLLVFAEEQSIICKIVELYRSRAKALLNAMQGKGIKNSLHILGLAADLAIFDERWRYLDGARAGDHLPYGQLALFWKQLSTTAAVCRWGGDFHTIQDYGHFSIEHEGRQ